MAHIGSRPRVWLAALVVGTAVASVVVGAAGYFVGGFKTDSGLSCSRATGDMAGTFWCDVDSVWTYLMLVGAAVLAAAIVALLLYSAREIRRM